MSSEKVDIYGYETATLASAGFAVSFFVPFSTLKVQNYGFYACLNI